MTCPKNPRNASEQKKRLRHVRRPHQATIHKWLWLFLCLGHPICVVIGHAITESQYIQLAGYIPWCESWPVRGEDAMPATNLESTKSEVPQSLNFWMFECLIFEPLNVWMFESLNLWNYYRGSTLFISNIQRFKDSNIQRFKHSNIQTFKDSMIETWLIILVRHFFNHWMFEGLKVWMFESLNVWMFECLNVWMFECLNVSVKGLGFRVKGFRV